MPTVSAVVIALLAVALLVGAVLLHRSRGAHAWPAIGVAALTSGICFTVGGEGSSGSGPSLAIVIGGFVGLLSVAAGIAALVPQRTDRPPSRTPLLIAVAAIVVGAAGLLVSLLTS